MSQNIARNAYKLFIGNLPWTVGNRELQKHFSKFGHVATATVVFNKDNGLSKGYGFVTYSTRDGFNMAANKTYQSLDGRILTIQMANT